MHSAISRTTRRLASALSLLAAASPAATLGAQEVVGTLRRVVDGLTPAVGVLVVAERLVDGAVVARTVSGPRGAFRLRVPSEPVVVRALRIGQAPFVLDTVRLASSEVRELAATLPDAAVALPNVSIVADARCQLAPDAARRVASRFSEARTALLASQVDPPEVVVRSRVRVHTREGTAPARMQEGSIAAVRAFRGAPFDSIERSGFVVSARDGTTRFRAPDADLLVDARFLARYCLHDVPTPDSLRGWVGIGFRPIDRRRQLVEVRGTLWLDSASASLRRLTFGYVGADPLVEQAGAGGQLEYERLDNGVWFVRRWLLRTPRIGEATVLRRRDMRGGTLREVTGLQVLEGEVVDVRLGASLAFTTGTPAATDRVGGDAEAIALTTQRERTCGASTDPVLVGYAVRALDGNASRVVPELQADVRVEGTGRVLAQARTDEAGRFIVCGIRPGVTWRVTATTRSGDTQQVLLRMPDAVPVARVDFVQPPQ